LYISWDESFSVGVFDFDADHRKLLSLLNDLQAACEASQGTEKIEKILKELLEYTKYHFSREEAVLEEHGYSKLADQKRLHKEFTSRIEKLSKDFHDNPSTKTASKAVSFLGRWLTEHINGEDKAYAPHLKMRGVS
jgi:hemerythrin